MCDMQLNRSVGPPQCILVWAARIVGRTAQGHWMYGVSMLIILRVAADPRPEALGPGAMACISRNYATHGPRLPERIYSTKAADRLLVPHDRYRHVYCKLDGPRDCMGAARMRFIHVKVSIKLGPSPV